MMATMKRPRVLFLNDKHHCSICFLSPAPVSIRVDTESPLSFCLSCISNDGNISDLITLGKQAIASRKEQK